MDYTTSGQYPNANGQSIFPGTSFLGPVFVGSQLATSGTALSGLGQLAPVGVYANAGVVTAAQSQVITQLTNGSNAGVYTSTIVLPAQSQILRITMMVTTAWTGASATFGIGNTASATAYTAAGAGTGVARGQIVLTPGSDATKIGLWDNVGNTDVQIVITSTNTGNGVGTLTVEYVPMINLAS